MEIALLTPLLMLLLMGFVQFALAEHAEHIAQAAAVRALATAREADSSAAAGRSSGQDALAQLAGSVLTHASVTVTRTADQASAQVSGQVLSLVPGLHPWVHARVSGPVERFTQLTSGG